MNWTEELLNEIVPLMSELSDKEIAAKFGFSHVALTSALKYRGIKRTPEQNKAIHTRVTTEYNVAHSGDKNPNWKGGISENYYHYKKLQIERYPEKDRARRAVKHAVKSGKLVKTPCELCGNEKVVAHHDDYSKPLEVRWVCRHCHRYKIHDGKH